MEPVEERVRRGAALLDEKMPGWWTRISSRLDMARNDQCILGQLTGSYSRGLDMLGLELGYTHGFGALIGEGLPDAMTQYRELCSAWRKMLKDTL